MLIAAGLLLPSLFHLVPDGGNLFLPMHLPVFLAAFILPAPHSFAVAVLTPLLSALLTGMPPVFPVLPIMTAELATYALLTALFSRKLKWNRYIVLVLAMMGGRGALVLIAFLLKWISGNFNSVAYIVNALTKGIPGMAIQLLFVPPVVYAVKKSMGYPAERTKKKGNE